MSKSPRKPHSPDGGASDGGLTTKVVKSLVADAFHGGGTSAKQYERFLHGADVYKDL